MRSMTNEATHHVLIVDDDDALADLVVDSLRQHRYGVSCVGSATEALDAMRDAPADVVLLDIQLPDASGLDVLTTLRERYPRTPVVMLTAVTNPDTIVAAVQGGAYDYLVKPIDPNKLHTSVRNAVEMRRMSERLVQLEQTVASHVYGQLVGQSAAMRTLFAQLDRIIAADVSVLVHGESGTGKELVARLVHDRGPRRSGPFVAINCAAIPETLQESEFFGHERGAFTGATTRHLGKFELADGGTLFLDEVAELSPLLQAKLLRALQEKSFFRVGGTSEVRADFRLIAASHRDLRAEVKGGRFREDLYFRVAVYDLEVPALRERGEDILLLAYHFLREFAPARELTLDGAVRARLANYPWPGNVRELQNAMQRAAVSARGNQIRLSDLPGPIRESVTDAPVDSLFLDDEPNADAPTPPLAPTSFRLHDVERAAIIRAVQQAGGNLSEAGRLLGIGRTTLYRKLERHGLR